MVDEFEIVDGKLVQTLEPKTIPWDYDFLVKQRDKTLAELTLDDVLQRLKTQKLRDAYNKWQTLVLKAEEMGLKTAVPDLAEVKASV